MNPFQHKGAWLALLFVVALPVWGQIDTGAVMGRVSDSSGAVVARAQVSIVQTETNFEALTQTNDEGMYRVQSLRPGPYRVTITAPGFKRSVREGLDIRVGDAQEVDATLEVGATSDSVQVTAAAPLLETQTSATGLSVEGQYFYSLPIYKRNVPWVLYFTPDVQYTAGPRGGGMNVDGLTASAAYFDDGVLGQSHTIENSVADIKVLTTTLPAEYGHSAGGAISVVKLTGTNQLHGIASMFGRTRLMQQRKFFDMYRNSQVQPGFTAPLGMFFYQPDANFNGPVYIPKIYDGRNKTFFMIAWQRQIEKQSKQQLSTVPSPAELGGDFSFGGVGQAIYDPRSRTQLANGNWTATPFPNNFIPISNWSHVAQTVLALHPYGLPNVPGSLTATGPANNAYASIFKFYREQNWSVRLDQQFTPNVKAFLTWTYFQSTDHTPPYTVAKNSMFDPTQLPSKPTTTTPGAGVTWVISPSFMTDIRAGMNRSYTYSPSIAYNQNYASKLGIPNLPSVLMPQIWPGGFTEGLNVGGPSTSVNETLTFKDDTTKLYGQHAFKWGYDLLRNRSNSSSPGNVDGSFSYTGTSGLLTNGTSMPNTGNTFATFLIGAISSDSFNYNLMANLPRNWMHSFYVQDDWKIHPNLTLNYGVRYELETPPVQKYGQISIFNPTVPDTSQYTNYTCPAGGCLGAFTHPTGSYPYHMQTDRFDPRFGLAWHSTEKLVVRAGFAMSHADKGTGYLYTDELLTQSTSQAQAVGNPKPLFMLDNGPPAIVYPALRADGSVPFVGNPGGHSATINMQNMRASYTMTWNAGVQYQMQKDYLVEVRYTASAQVGFNGSYDTNSRPLGIIPDPSGNGYMNLSDPANAAYRNTWLSTTQYSRPWPAWGNLSIAGNTGHLTHHAGTVKLEKRYSKGLNFTAFYTLGKTLTGNAMNPYENWGLNKARPSYDQKHSFTGTMSYEIPIGKGRKWMNRGGLLNTLVGDFNFVWTYSIESGNPGGLGISGSSAQQYPSYMPTYGNVMLLKNPHLRDNWQDLGGDRFTQNNQNSMINCGFDGSFVLNWGDSCMVARPSFTNGTDGGNVWEVQRTIAASMSASKEVTIHERLKFQFRYDFQNPFKWYNLASPNSTLSINSVSNSKSFGTTSVGGEAVTTNYGGLPLMNITLAFKW